MYKFPMVCRYEYEVIWSDLVPDLVDYHYCNLQLHRHIAALAIL